MGAPSIQGPVWPVVVVVMQPGWECVQSLLVGCVGTDIGPLALQGQVQPLGLAVGGRPVRAGAHVDHPSGGQNLTEDPGPVRRFVPSA
jgi:hypothetical protein